MDLADFRQIVLEIAALFERCYQHDQFYEDALLQAATLPDEEFTEFLKSNELWGGSGSLADSGFEYDDAHPTLKRHRGELEILMIQLGQRQMTAGLVNVRTGMWVKALEKWRDAGIRNV